MNTRVRTAILISGAGTNMQALIKASHAPDYPAEIALVIANTNDAGGITIAQSLGVPSVIIDHKSHKSRQNFEAQLDRKLRDANIDLICCAGFMRILTPWFVSRWHKRVFNIHPSLLPKYKGLNTYARALAAGDSEHGCTVHYVNENIDDGDIIAQARISIDKNDTVESLAKRVLVEEHKLYPQALADLATQFPFH